MSKMVKEDGEMLKKIHEKIYGADIIREGAMKRFERKEKTQ